jgi:shikimate dehydrogenase
VAALKESGGDPARIVLIGHPVAHSLSPLFQNAAIRAAGINAVYEAVDVRPDGLDSEFELLRRIGAAGNVTVPYKRRVHDMCDLLGERAQRTGAVNTFTVREGKLVGDNTDVGGFNSAVHLLLGRKPAGERVAVLGAGGAAAAVLAAIENWPGSSVTLWNRSESRLAEIRARFPAVPCTTDDVQTVLDGATLIVNATSAGLREGEFPCDPAHLPAGAAVLDLVYGAGSTAFLEASRKRGLRASDGREMLLEQGALAFVQWFGREPDRMVMRRALEGGTVGG